MTAMGVRSRDGGEKLVGETVHPAMRKKEKNLGDCLS